MSEEDTQVKLEVSENGVDPETETVPEAGSEPTIQPDNDHHNDHDNDNDITGEEEKKEVSEPVEENTINDSIISKDPVSSSSSSSSASKNYPKLYQKYLEKFKKAYTISQSLYEMERDQRQTLYYYKRRNNILLDMLQEFESGGDYKAIPSVEDILHGIDGGRLEDIIKVSPKLESKLAPVLQLLQPPPPQSDDNTDNDQATFIDRNNLLNLYLDEQIPDLIQDDLISLESNPQDAENWSKRHYPHLQSHKFKPFDIPPKGVIHEYIGSDYKFGDEASNGNGNGNSDGKHDKKSIMFAFNASTGNVAKRKKAGGDTTHTTTKRGKRS